MHDFDALLDRLQTADRPVAFVVGAPLSATFAPPAGVPGVAAMIERVETWAQRSGIGKKLKAALDAVGDDVGARYRAAFAFVDGRRGHRQVDKLVASAVREARLPDAPAKFTGDGHPEHWHLPRGTAALGRLLVEQGERFTGPVITTNFDPLISLAITAAGGRPQRRVLARDGALPTDDEADGGVPVAHLHGYWRSPRTRHQPHQLEAPRPQLAASLRVMLRDHIVVVLAYGGWHDAFMKALTAVAYEPGAGVEVLWALFETDAAARETRTALIERAPSLESCTFYAGIDAHRLLPVLLGDAPDAEPADSGPAPIRIGRPGVSLPGFSVAPGSMIGGPALVARLRAMLDDAGRASIGQVAAAVGHGGLGKSRLAWEYAHAHRADYPGGIFWFEADQDAAGLDSQLARIAVELRWTGAASDLKSSIQVGKRALLSLEGRALFIFDNVEQLDPITHLLPDPRAGHHVLLTSRHEQSGRVLDMQYLDVAEGVALLAAVSGRMAPDDRAEAEAIARWADGLPLVLELVAAYLARRPTTTWAEARRSLEARSLESRLVKPKPGIERPVHRHAKVDAALRVDPALLADHPLLAKALDALAALAPAPMGAELLAALVEPEDDEAWADELDLGCTLKLMTRDDAAGEPRYRMHRLLREVYRRGRDDAADEALLDRLGAWGEARRDGWKTREGPPFGEDTAHLQAGVEAAEQGGAAGEVAGRLLWLWGFHLGVRGDMDAARSTLARARAAARPAGAADSVLAVMIDSTDANLSGGAQALALARAVYDRARGVDGSPMLTAETRFVLADQLVSAGRLDEAQVHAEAALATLRPTYESTHWRVLNVQSSLGRIVARQGERDGVALAREAFAAVDGQRSRATIAWLDAANALGDSLNSTHRFTEALRLTEETVAACRLHLGAKHPTTLSEEYNLATVLGHLGRFAEARAALTRCRDDATAALGAENGIAINCTAMDILQRANQRPRLRGQAIARLRAMAARLPPDHPSQFTIAHHLRELGAPGTGGGARPGKKPRRRRRK